MTVSQTQRKRDKFPKSGALPGGEALLVRQNPVLSDQRATAQMNFPSEILEDNFT